MNDFGGSFNLFNPFRFNFLSLGSIPNSQRKLLMLGLLLRSRENSAGNVQMHKGTVLNRLLLRFREMRPEALIFMGNEDRRLSERSTTDKLADQ